jgi:tRNA modification GTPase
LVGRLTSNLKPQTRNRHTFACMALPASYTETIVALATAPGMGAIAVVRLSGKEAIEIAEKVFVSAKGKKGIKEKKTHTLHFGKLVDNDIVVDEVLLSLFKAPNSYTGEDVVEISCHGSVFIQQNVIQLLIKNGARLARTGEFTLRAFLNGKMDLSQAEAVADLVASDSASSHQLAMQQMRGGYSDEMKQLRQQLINFASLIELELDFNEEDVEFANREQLKTLIENINIHITNLISSFELGNVIKQGVPVVIAGKPNVGKSTLLNALLNEERAIVSHIAGTTRDTIEEEITLDGIKFRFIDTAGLRATSDAIESIGVGKTYEKLRQSPVIIYLFDVNETTAASLKEELDELKKNIHMENYKLILAGNKVDQSGQDNQQISKAGNQQIIFISAKEKNNIEELISALLQQINKGEVKMNDSIVTNARHVEALQNTKAALEKVIEGLNNRITTDLLASDIRTALYHLGEITGEVTTDNLLENIFSKFCIGK